jgi:oligopeptidase A
MNSEPLRAAYNACLPLLSDYHTDLAQSEKLYAAYRRVGERDGARLSAEQRAVIEHALRDFRLAGVALDPGRKARFKQVMMELARLGSKFDENVLDATNVELAVTTRQLRASMRALSPGPRARKPWPTASGSISPPTWRW